MSNIPSQSLERPIDQNVGFSPRSARSPGKYLPTRHRNIPGMPVISCFSGGGVMMHNLACCAKTDVRDKPPTDSPSRHSMQA